MKKIVLVLCTIMCLTITVNADTWRDGFVTRLMKLMTSDPSFTDVVLTDIDQNGIPEAFLLKKGTGGSINSGITLKNNVLLNIEAPKNITGSCLEDITLYDMGTKIVPVGKEVSRYTGHIKYYELSIVNDALVCTPVEKSKYSKYPSLAYVDYYSGDLHTDGYPNRKKIEEFINAYESSVSVKGELALAKITVDANVVNVSGFNIDGNNYYKIRDIAMIMRGTDSKFEVSWDSEKSLIKIIKGEKYTSNGTELESSAMIGHISPVSCAMIVDDEQITVDGYNIDGSNYFKIRDLARIAGFSVAWDDETQTVALTTE